MRDRATAERPVSSRMVNRPVGIGSLPVHPVFLAAYPVLFLWAANVNAVSVRDIWRPLGLAVGGAVVSLALGYLVVREIRRAALVASAIVVTFAGYGHVALLLEPAGVGRDLALVGVLVAFTLATALALRARRLVLPLTSALNALAIALVVIVLPTIVSHQLQRATTVRAAVLDTLDAGESRLESRRDIYYLVLDRYGSRSALAVELGITDNDLEPWLAEQGFTVARDAVANYGRTSLSMASVLNMSYLDDLARAPGRDSSDLEPLNELLQEHRAGAFLKDHGYRYVHIGSWFGPTKTSRLADENLEYDATPEFDRILAATTLLPEVERLVSSTAPPMPGLDQHHYQAARFQFRELSRTVGEPGPKFVLAHVLLPHDPYVFDATGAYLSPERRATMPVADQFGEQLAYVNSEIRTLVSQLLELPESERPIIVIQADEGPYPERYAKDQAGFDWNSATPAELRMKYGILNAFFFPAGGGTDTAAVYDTISSVNTFRVVLRESHGADLPLLPDRSYVSPYDRPYDFEDITSRLGGR